MNAAICSTGVGTYETAPVSSYVAQDAAERHADVVS